MSDRYDFIIVGAGPAGCAVAARLAESAAKPRVLLVEAGGWNAEKSVRIDGERWLTRMNPHMNWGYKTTPQSHMDDRQIDYDRGKGLGGSSAINFSVYDVGPRDDFEEIARLTGDKDWNWANAQDRLKRIENFHGTLAGKHARYLQPRAEDHGHDGRLQIGFPAKWDITKSDALEMFEESGLQLNPDMNSGNPIGWSPTPSSAYRGLRSTAADLLSGTPENLDIVVNALTERVIFDDSKTAVGVVAGGKSYYATKEVILSTGSLNSPQILMLSGVGPQEQLRKHSIPVVHELEPVGKNLSDHIHTWMLWRRADYANTAPAYYRDEAARAAARVQWEKDQTGPLAEQGVGLVLAWEKIQAIYESEEFKRLPEDRKRHLLRETVPAAEFITNLPDFRDLVSPSTSEASLSSILVLLNGESRGEVTLASSNPADAPIMDPKFLSHEYDRRAVVESTRRFLQIMQMPAIAKDTLTGIIAPASESEEDILAFWRANAVSTWHMAGTVKMGRAGDNSACVDTDLRVRGVQRLRVADMSVMPLQPNNHTQTSAYHIGVTMGDKLAREYRLDE